MSIIPFWETQNMACKDMTWVYHVLLKGLILLYSTKNDTFKECFYPLMLVPKKHMCKHDGKYKKD